MKSYFAFLFKIKIALTLILLSGCAGKVSTVYIPVSSCPDPPVLAMPELAVMRLSQKPATTDALKALAEDHIILRDSLEQCITILDGYRK